VALLSGCAGPVPEELYAQGRKAFDSVDYRRAADKLDQFVTEFPEHQYVPPAYYFLGKARERLGDATGAIEAFQEAEKRALTPDLRIESQVFLASLYRELGEWDRAIGMLRALVSETSGANRKNFAIELALTLRSAGRVDDASAYLGERIRQETDPRFRGEYLLSLADVHWATDELDTLLPILNALIEDASVPRDLRVRGFYWKSRAFEQAGRFDDAVRTFENLGETFPGTVDAAEARAELAALYRDRDPELAESHLRAATEAFARLVEEATDSAETRNVLRARIAEAYARVQRYEDAIAAYEQLRRLNPDDDAVQQSVTRRLQQIRSQYARDTVVEGGLPPDGG